MEVRGLFNKKFLIPLIMAVMFISCDSKTPVISSISPKIGRMGEIITLNGNNFGAPQDDSFITIAGAVPTASSYYLWQDDLIMVRVPEFGESGLVYVHTNGKRSNGILFSNLAVVPQPVESGELGIGPRISSVTPQAGPPGTLLTITGNNFGGSREGGGVFFSWDYESYLFNQYAVREPEFIEVSEQELGYVSWSAREITVRVPDGAVRGNLEVRTSSGRSPPFSFDVTGIPGRKTLSDKRSYTIRYSIDIGVNEAARPNTLYLWAPRPVYSPSQRNIKSNSTNIEPFMENYRGVNLYRLENLSANTNQSVELSFNVDVYSVETEINPVSVRQDSSYLSALYTQSTRLLPADDDEIKSAVGAIIGREQNPYIKAKLLYDWIISNIEINEYMYYSAAHLAETLEQKQADPYSAALLCTVMMRAAGIPCIPAAGVLIGGNRQTIRHYWTEFWLDDFGWVPVDVVMGAGAVPQQFLFKENYTDYYFGNIDNRRIAFSRGEVNLSQIESRGRTVSHTHSYSLQNIWEEASGGLESYNSFWGDITITGVYAQ